MGIQVFQPPYSYVNNANELVGYDIAYAYQLARDLDCTIEFVAGDMDRVGEQLAAGDFDLGMGSFLMTENRLKTTSLTRPYQAEDNVLMVPRTNKNQFMNFKDIKYSKLKSSQEEPIFQLLKVISQMLKLYLLTP